MGIVVNFNCFPVGLDAQFDCFQVGLEDKFDCFTVWIDVSLIFYQWDYRSNLITILF